MLSFFVILIDGKKKRVHKELFIFLINYTRFRFTSGRKRNKMRS